MEPIWDIPQNSFKMLDMILTIRDWKSIQEEGFPMFSKAFDHMAFTGAQNAIFSRFLNTILPKMVSCIKFKNEHGVSGPFGVVVAAKLS